MTKKGEAYIKTYSRRPKPVSAKTAPTRDTEREFWEFVKNGDPYPDHCAGQQSRGYCDDRCPYNDENGLCPYEHETKSRMNEYAENFFKKNNRPNFRQALKDKKEFYVKVTPELSEELQKVASEYIYVFGHRPFKDVSLIFFKEGENLDTEYTSWIMGTHKPETEYDPTTDTFKEPIQKEIIGNHSDKADELPEPIKFEDEVPEYCYIAYENEVKRIRIEGFEHLKLASGRDIFKIFDIEGNTYSFYDCYRTLDEAVKIFKSKEG